jgi:hypothetical protein
MTAATPYTLPDNPIDPEAAALELIVRFPEMILHTDAFRSVLQDYAGALDAESAFAGCPGRTPRTSRPRSRSTSPSATMLRSSSPGGPATWSAANGMGAACRRPGRYCPATLTLWTCSPARPAKRRPSWSPTATRSWRSSATSSAARQRGRRAARNKPAKRNLPYQGAATPATAVVLCGVKPVE